MHPFAPYLKFETPEALQEIDEFQHDGVRVRRVIFQSRQIEKGGTQGISKVFAAIAIPDKPGPHPGILILHGGTGSAEVDRAVAWARRGYVAVAPDLPGIGKNERMPHSEGAWKSEAYGQGFWRADPDATQSSIFDGVVAALQAFRLLQNLPEVDRNHVGIIGNSWGGALTLTLAGLFGSEVKAAFSIYGCGFFDQTVFANDLARISSESKQKWLELLDPGVWAGQIQCPVFITAASNDSFFWPPAVNRTLEEIPGRAGVVFAPNLNHSTQFQGGGEVEGEIFWTGIETVYFDYHLRGMGKALPEVHVLPTDNEDPRRVAFRVKAEVPLASAVIYATDSSLPWKEKIWKAVPAELVSLQHYAARLPDTMKLEATNWYVFITDERPVSVSSPVLPLTTEMKNEK